jgi:hypothetical protein
VDSFRAPGNGWRPDGFRLTGGLAKPNALLEQIWNLGGFTYFDKLPSEEHLRNSLTSIDADNPSNTAYFSLLFSRPLIPAPLGRMLTKGREMECLD